MKRTIIRGSQKNVFGVRGQPSEIWLAVNVLKWDKLQGNVLVTKNTNKG